MQTVVFVIMVLVCLNFIFKQTYRKWYSVLATSVVAMFFIGCTWKYAIEQSKSQIAVWLSDTDLMLDTAVIITLDVFLQITFCMVAAHIQNTGILNKRTVWTYRILRWFPGVLIFPVLFCLLVYAIFAMPGYPFETVAWGTAVLVGISIPAVTYVIKWLLPEKEIRLEFLFLVNMLIALLSIIATVNGRTAVNGITAIDWSALAGLLALLIVGLATGLTAYRIKIKKTIKHIQL